MRRSRARWIAQARGHCRRAKATVRRWRRLWWGRRGAFVWREITFARLAARAADPRPPDLCIAHDAFALRAGHRLATRAGGTFLYDAVEVPAVGERTGAVYRRIPRVFCRILDLHHAYYIRRADAIMTIGPAMGRWIARRFPRSGRITVIRNMRDGRDYSYSDDIRHDLGVGPGERVVLHLNAVVPGNGMEDLVTATSRLPPHVHVALLGRVGGRVRGPSGEDVSYEQVLADEVRRHGVGERFHVLPVKPVDEVVAYASGADVGVILLHSEVLNVKLSLPNRVFDLIAARLPIATTPIEDIAELVRAYGVGLTFEGGDADSLVAALNDILRPERLAMLRERTDRAARELVWSRERARFLDLIRELGVPEDGHVCIVAYKDISEHARIARLARALVDSGRTVEVIARNAPHEGIRVPQVSYVVVDPLPAAAAAKATPTLPEPDTDTVIADSPLADASDPSALKVLDVSRSRHP